MAVADRRVAGRYRLGPSLGVGGMGRVRLARDEVLKRDVAVKEIVLPIGLADDETVEIRMRTLREARAAARLNHPNVVRIYDVVPGEQQPWIVMEYVRSRSLLEVIKEDGPLPVVNVARIGLAILSALDAGNRVGVLHRDVKPSNVLIADDGRVVLTDFGSAMLDETEGAITRTGIILGSPDYIAPERVRSGVSTPESDLWSLGATLYEAVEGRPPYTRATPLSTLIALASQRPDPMKRAGPLRPVINGLLQRNPRARLRASEVERRLRRIAGMPSEPHPVPAQRTSPENATSPGTNSATADLRPSQVTDIQTPAPATTALAHPGEAPVKPTASWRSSDWVGWAIRQRRWLLSGLVAVLLASAALGTFAVLRHGTTGGGTGHGSVASGPVLSSPSLLPSGFTRWDDPSGYSITVPARLERFRQGGDDMLFRDPENALTLRISAVNDTSRELIAVLADSESQLKSAGYKKIRLETVTSNRAEFEYTMDDPSGRLHGLDRAFTASGRTFILQWRTPEAAWQANIATFAFIASSFQSR